VTQPSSLEVCVATCGIVPRNDAFREKDSDWSGLRLLDAFSVVVLDATTKPSITLNERAINIRMSLGLIMNS
jgi:hypothetical protein